MAVDVIENGLDKTWELPIVYVTSLGGSSLTSADSPGQYYFLKGVGFDQVDFQNVGIDEESTSLGEISIYPNPTQSTFTINLETFTQPSSITIYDILGKTITSKQFITNQTEINLTGNNKGVYFINIQTENGTTVRKIILQ
jgi:hypothetical protein